MKCPKEMVVYMHEYLDNEISAEHERELKRAYLYVFRL